MEVKVTKEQFDGLVEAVDTWKKNWNFDNYKTLCIEYPELGLCTPCDGAKILLFPDWQEVKVFTLDGSVLVTYVVDQSTWWSRLPENLLLLTSTAN